MFRTGIKCLACFVTIVCITFVCFTPFSGRPRVGEFEVISKFKGARSREAGSLADGVTTTRMSTTVSTTQKQPFAGFFSDILRAHASEISQGPYELMRANGSLAEREPILSGIGRLTVSAANMFERDDMLRRHFSDASKHNVEFVRQFLPVANITGEEGMQREKVFVVTIYMCDGAYSSTGCDRVVANMTLAGTDDAAGGRLDLRGESAMVAEGGSQRCGYAGELVNGKENQGWWKWLFYGSKDAEVGSEGHLGNGRQHGHAVATNYFDGAGTAWTGEIVSIECNLRLRLATDSVATYVEFRAARYAVLKILMVLLQIYSFRVQSQHAPDRSREMRADGTAVGLRAESVSILTIVNLAIGDVFDSVLHVTFIWASSCTVRLLLVLLAAARGFYSFSWALTYAFEIWRDRHRELFRRPNSKMRAVVMAEQFNSLICFTVPFGSFLLMLNAEANGITAATLGLQAMWVPQILSDAWSSVAAPLHPHFILASSWARCLQVLYIWGCPRSLFSGGYAGMGGGDGKLLLPGLTSTLPVLNSSVCAIVVSMHVGQLAVMVGQRTWRPRFFVPWLCMPWAYNYRNAANLAASESQDCAICMMELETSKDVKGKGTRRVVAPCGHVFHEPCLERWMQVKMECPTCRGLLPRMI